jgi:viroplasmin and RNaseH domain-containing protein
MNKSFFLEKLLNLADGDIEYLKELKELYGKFFSDLRHNYSQIYQQDNLESWSYFVHKAKPSIAYLNLQEVQDFFEEGELLKKKNEKENTEIQKHFHKVEEICNKYLDFLRT